MWCILPAKPTRCRFRQQDVAVMCSRGFCLQNIASDVIHMFTTACNTPRVHRGLKMNESKNRGGRPRRTVEKLQRITLNLRPSILFGLDMVARDRRTSLSQAAEYLLNSALRPYKLGDTPIMASLDKVTAILCKDAGEEREQEIQSLLLASEGGRALLMPRELKSSAEQYFNSTFSYILGAEWPDGEGDPIMVMLDPAVMTKLFELAKNLEAGGTPVEEAGKLLAALAHVAIKESMDNDDAEPTEQQPD